MIRKIFGGMSFGFIKTIFKLGAAFGAIFGVFAGLIAGLTGGLLVAPTSGKKLRNKIKDETLSGARYVSEKGKELKSNGARLLSELAEESDNGSNAREDKRDENDSRDYKPHVQERVGEKVVR